MYVYRFESKARGLGPWSFMQSPGASKLKDLQDWHDYGNGNRYDSDDFPSWDEDFSDKRFWLHPEEYGKYRFGVHLPCLILYWFGPDFLELHKYFNVYKIKVKNYEIGKSGKQVIWKPEDEVSEHILINLKKITIHGIPTI